MRKYRGKYPTRIKEVWGAFKGKAHFCRTNDGVVYFIRAIPGGKLPNLGDDATEHPACVLMSVLVEMRNKG